MLCPVEDDDPEETVLYSFLGDESDSCTFDPTESDVLASTSVGSAARGCKCEISPDTHLAREEWCAIIERSVLR